VLGTCLDQGVPGGWSEAREGQPVRARLGEGPIPVRVT